MKTDFFYRNEIVSTERVMCKEIPSRRNKNPRRHWHSYHELIYVISGSVTLSYETFYTDISTGDLALITPGVIHDTYIKEEYPDTKIMVIQSDLLISSEHTEFVHLFTESLRENSSPVYIIRGYSDLKDNIHRLCCMMLDESKNKISGYDRILSGGFLQLIGYFERVTGYAPFPMLNTAGKNFDIYKICAYINDNIKTVTLCDAADFSGYSENYFSTLFKSVLGSGFKQYVDFVRFRRAEHMMIMGSMNVSEIADALGFDSVQNFSRSFKRIVGCTPTMYIKKFRIITQIAIRPKT